MAKKPKTKHRIPIDWSLVDKYLIGGAKGTEIAGAIGVHEETLYNRCKEEQGMIYTAYSAKLKQKGDTMLHTKQFQVAMNGNTSMLIWLGKQRLGQTDQPKNSDTFNGSLASLLDVMHLIKTSSDFDALVKMANKNTIEIKEKKAEENV